jgi:hypothetical protein
MPWHRRCFGVIGRVGDVSGGLSGSPGSQQVAAIERVDWRGALRSAELTTDNYLHVLALFVVIDVLTFGITTAGGALAGNSTHLAEVLIAIALATITRSFAALTTALLFYDLLARKRQLRRESDPESRIPRDYDQPS